MYKKNYVVVEETRSWTERLGLTLHEQGGEKTMTAVSIQGENKQPERWTRSTAMKRTGNASKHNDDEDTKTQRWSRLHIGRQKNDDQNPRTETKNDRIWVVQCS